VPAGQSYWAEQNALADGTLKFLFDFGFGFLIELEDLKRLFFLLFFFGRIWLGLRSGVIGVLFGFVHLG